MKEEGGRKGKKLKRNEGKTSIERGRRDDLNSGEEELRVNI